MFNAYQAPAANTSPVCRLYSNAFAPKDAHFYTPFVHECLQLRANALWMLESDAVFHIPVPSNDGSCAAGHLPVYRLFNRDKGGAPNHRNTTDRNLRAQMIAQGWSPEGLGADGVQMCAPR